MDETYIKIKGQWKYLYRAVDSEGQTVDFLLTAQRDKAAALGFFKKAFRQHGEPKVVTIDKSGANTSALAAINAPRSKDKVIVIRQNKYLNNLVEQDHRNIKRRIKSMLGFKSFMRAQTILAGSELVNMVCKGQLQHPKGDGLSPAGQFYCQLPKKNHKATPVGFSLLLQQNHNRSKLIQLTANRRVL